MLKLPVTKVGFTGTQVGMNAHQLDLVSVELQKLKEQGATEFHHGVCIGADTQAHFLAKHLGYKIVGHPPVDESKMTKGLEFDFLFEPNTHLARNRNIVNLVDHMIATPQQHGEVVRSGTWYTVRYTMKMNKPITIIYPTEEIENA